MALASSARLHLGLILDPGHLAIGGRGLRDDLGDRRHHGLELTDGGIDARRGDGHGQNPLGPVAVAVHRTRRSLGALGQLDHRLGCLLEGGLQLVLSALCLADLVVEHPGLVEMGQPLVDPLRAQGTGKVVELEPLLPGTQGRFVCLAELCETLLLGPDGGPGRVEPMLGRDQGCELGGLVVAYGLLLGHLVERGEICEAEHACTVGAAALERVRYRHEALAAVLVESFAADVAQPEGTCPDDGGGHSQGCAGERSGHDPHDDPAHRQQDGDRHEHPVGLEDRAGPGGLLVGAAHLALGDRQVATALFELGQLTAELTQQEGLPGGALGLDAHRARVEVDRLFGEQFGSRGHRRLRLDDLLLVLLEVLGGTLTRRGLLVEGAARDPQVVAGRDGRTDPCEVRGMLDPDDVELEVEAAPQVRELLASTDDLFLLLDPTAQPMLQRGDVGLQHGEVGTVPRLEDLELGEHLVEIALSTFDVGGRGFDRRDARAERLGGVGRQRRTLGPQRSQRVTRLGRLEVVRPQLDEALGALGPTCGGVLTLGQIGHTLALGGQRLASLSELAGCLLC